MMKKLSSHYTPYTTSWNRESQLEERNRTDVQSKNAVKTLQLLKEKEEYAVLISNGLLAPVSISPDLQWLPSMECHDPQRTHIQHMLPLAFTPPASPFLLFFLMTLQLFYSCEWEGISGYFRSALCERGKKDWSNWRARNIQSECWQLYQIKLYIILTYIFRSTEIWELHSDTEET